VGGKLRPSRRLLRPPSRLTLFAAANTVSANIAGASMRRPYYTQHNLERENSVGFLVKRSGVLLTQIAERRFEKTGSVTFTQWLVLAWLSSQQDHLSPTQLSRDLGHDMGALTRVVDELERRGLLRRERSRKDRRAVEIAITAEGRRAADEAKRVLLELLNELVQPYSLRELETLISLLQRLLQHLEVAAAKESHESAGRGAARRKSTARRSHSTGAP
jgi:DNA-binding MarR family transcriptional regulator